jgi:uncharacterized protein (DUF488 family)
LSTSNRASAERSGTDARPFYTIGHSTRTIEEFVSLLKEAGVTLVADVRTIPRSRTNPQYNQDVLPHSLAKQGIEYQHLMELGGRRGRQRAVAPDLNAYWQHASFHNYADYALSDSFKLGLARLRVQGREQPCAIMCSEAVWWRCHRRIITDYLLAAGESVLHILAPKHIEPATLTPAAHAGPDGVTYPGLI